MSDKKPDVVLSFKGFNDKWQCRDYQFEVGKTYVHNGRVVRCAEGGFHSCEYPLDVFSYYPPVGDNCILNKFAQVECSGEIARDDFDSKIASACLTVKAELTIPALIDYAVRWILDRIEDTKVEANTGNRSAASVEGKDSVAIATGSAGRAKASEGSAIVLVFRDENQKLIHIKAGIAGRDGIKADTWYSLNKYGEFVEVVD